MENDNKLNKKKGKKHVLTVIIAVIGFVIGYNIRDLFLDILLGGRPF